MKNLLWKGPAIDGVSQSMMNDFYICKYRFFLKYCLGLEDREELEPNLIWGTVFHKGLEIYIKSLDLELATKKMLGFLFDNYPSQWNSSFRCSLPSMLNIYDVSRYHNNHENIDTEVILDEIVTIDNYNYRCQGKIDVLEHGVRIVDHKAKGKVYPEETRAELLTDLQLNFYAKLAGVTQFGYELIRIPEEEYKLPERKLSESTESWVNRWFTGPGSTYTDFPILAKRHRWIHYIDKPSSQENIDLVWAKTVIPTLKAMREYYEYVSSDKFDINNLESFNATFYQTPVRHFNPILTSKFKGEFHELLIGEKELEDYARKTTCFPELEEPNRNLST